MTPIQVTSARILVSLAALAAPALAAPPQGGGQPCVAGWVPTFGSALDGPVNATATFDDGTGRALYAGGGFHNAAGQPLNQVAKWGGTSWSPLAGGTNGSVRCLGVFDDGSGPALYAGGAFSQAGGVSAPGIARWNGTSWSGLGQALGGILDTMAVFDDGSGPALFVGAASYGPAGAIAKWDGATWSGVGGGMSTGGGGSAKVYAFAVFDDGTGPRLIAGGEFQLAGGTPAANIASWDGNQWSALGTGTIGPVFSLAVYDHGAGPRLYAGGYFNMAGGIPANRVAAWDGTSWSNLAAGLDFDVYGLCGFDNGSSSALYAGGFRVDSFGSHPSIRTWNGASWSTLWAGAGGDLYSLAAHDLGGGPALYPSGGVSFPGGDLYIAKWGNLPGCGVPGVIVCEPGAGGVLTCPCGNPPAGSGRGCDNSSSTGGASLAASGIARLTYDSVVLATSGEKPTATSIVLQGDSLNASGATFGQGVRCAAGNLKRLYVKTASAGSITAPEGADLHVHSRSAALGDAIAPGTHRYYGVYYRDPSVLGGCPATSTFNSTQQLDVLWSN